MIGRYYYEKGYWLKNNKVKVNYDLVNIIHQMIKFYIFIFKKHKLSQLSNVLWKITIELKDRYLFITLLINMLLG